MAVKKGELKHIRIEPDTAKGSKGAHVTITKRISEGKNKGPWLYDENEERMSHPTPEKAAAHVLKTLKEHFGTSPAVDEDEGVTGAKASKGGKSAAAKAGHPASDNGPNASSDSWD